MMETRHTTTWSEGNQTFRTLYQYIQDKPEHSYLAIQQILKRLHEKPENIDDFCLTMNIKLEEGFMSIVPIPPPLTQDGQCFKKVLMGLKNTNKKWYLKNKYNCWIITKQKSVYKLKFLKQQEIKTNIHLLNPSTNLIGILVITSDNSIAQQKQQKFQHLRNRFLSIKRNKAKSECSRNMRSTPSLHSKIKIQKSTQKSSKEQANQQSKISRSHSSAFKKSRSKSNHMSPNSKYMSLNSIKQSNTVKSFGKAGIPKKAKFAVTYKARTTKI